MKPRSTAPDYPAADPGKRSGLKPLDHLVFGVVALVAIALAALRICPVDWLWASATILVVGAWAFVIHHRPGRRETSRGRPRVR